MKCFSYQIYYIILEHISKYVTYVSSLEMKKPQPRWLQNRINPNYTAMTRMGMSLKVMSRSHKGHKFILVVIDAVTNFMVATPTNQSRSEEIGDALIEHVFRKYRIPECVIMDQKSAFMSTLINYLLKKLGIKIKKFAPHNHQSLQAEHRIKSLATILAKYWSKYLPFAMYSYNTFCSPNINGFSNRN